jgi:8-oxo-dGTP diphosphatase
MAIGFPSCKGQKRPDKNARKILGKRGVTVFSVPCRQVVELGDSKESVIQNRDYLKKLNQEKLDVSLSQQTLAIIPKMTELDRFLQENPEYKNRICESHPEVCFARLAGHTVMTKKSTLEGIEERIDVLSRYISVDKNYFLKNKASFYLRLCKKVLKKMY